MSLPDDLKDTIASFMEHVEASEGGQPFVGEKATVVWAFVKVAANGDAGLLSMAVEDDGAMIRWPLVTSSRDMLPRYVEIAHQLAFETKMNVELRRYELVETFAMGPP